MRNLPLTFDYSTYSQKKGEDFAKFCGLLRIYELYQPGSSVMVVKSIASVVVFNSLVGISDGLPKTTNNATNPPIKAKSITTAKPNLSDR